MACTCFIIVGRYTRWVFKSPLRQASRARTGLQLSDVSISSALNSDKIYPKPTGTVGLHV